ncbi:MAG: hypothetical protein ACREVV_13135 [Steroidobacteraceae bacterium]
MNRTQLRSAGITLLSLTSWFGPGLCNTYADETYGAWSVAVSDDRSFVYAATTNDSGALLGEYCYPGKGSCMWILGTKTKCEEGAKYPMLANSNAGAFQLQVTCGGLAPNSLYSLAFTNFDDVDHLIKNGAKIGFAIPLQADEFRVIRFILNGSSQAITSMRSVATKMNVRQLSGKTGTKDQDI